MSDIYGIYQIGGPMSRNRWKEMQQQLTSIMKKEVSVMREVLANMHQEETHLLNQDSQSKDSLIGARSSLFERLGQLKTERLDVIRQLSDLLPFSKKNNPLDHLAIIDDEGYSEIQLLQGQFSALAERTRFQNQRNQLLEKRHLGVAIYNPVIKLYAEKKKFSVTTCEEGSE